MNIFSFRQLYSMTGSGYNLQMPEYWKVSTIVPPLEGEKDTSGLVRLWKQSEIGIGTLPYVKSSIDCLKYLQKSIRYH